MLIYTSIRLKGRDETIRDEEKEEEEEQLGLGHAAPRNRR